MWETRGLKAKCFLIFCLCLGLFGPNACINLEMGTAIKSFRNVSLLSQNKELEEFRFEGVSEDNHEIVKDLLVFDLATTKNAKKVFWTIGDLVFNHLNFGSKVTEGNDLPGKCKDLPLDKKQRYLVSRIKDPTKIDKIFSSFDVKMPFNSILSMANPLMKGEDFCIAFNGKNYGVGLSMTIPIPCFGIIGLCGLEITGVSVSTEGTLLDQHNKKTSIYDGFRTHTVDLYGNYAVQAKFKIPVRTQLDFFPIDPIDKIGFHVSIYNRLLFLGQFKRNNMLYLNVQESKIDVFFKSKNLYSLRLINMGIEGMLIDSVTNAQSTCFPSGVYVSARIGNMASNRFSSILLSALLGSGLIQFEASLNVGYYIDFRRSQQNGFFVRSETSIKLFNIFFVKATVEIQKVNLNELRRRKKSLQVESFCSSDYMITDVTQFMFDNFYNTYKTPEENPFYLEEASGSFRNLQFGSDLPFYFIGSVDTRLKISFWILPGLIEITSKLGGVFAIPSPIRKSHVYHMEFFAGATLHALFVDLLSVDLRLVVDDLRTAWSFEGSILDGFLEVQVRLAGPSSWLELSPVGTMLSAVKQLEKWKLKVSPKKLINSIVNGVKKVAKKLEQVYKDITTIVKAIRDDVKKVTDKFCFMFRCAISNILSTILGSIGGVLFSLFGSTKSSTNYNVGTNKYGCPIHEKVFKVCLFKCKVVRRERFDDKTCMDRIKAELLEAKHQEELADYKEEIMLVNMQQNQGLLWVIDEMGSGRNILSLEELEIEDISWENSNLLKYDYEEYERTAEARNRNIDPDDESFYADWEDKLNNMGVLEDTGEEIDPSQIYHLPESEKEVFHTEFRIRLPRLASTFRGKEEEKVEVRIPLTLNIFDPESFERTMTELEEKLTDEEGPLVKAVLGQNIGVTEDLLDALNMHPPEISLKNGNRQTIYCDDASIDRHYGTDDSMVIEMMRSHLTPLRIDRIYKRCNNNLQYEDHATCKSDEEICGATLCKYERILIDGCNQRSNAVYQEIRVLPRSPKFLEFPENFHFSCNQDVEVKEEEARFRFPKTHSGCRNALVTLQYNDVLNDANKCKETLYRDWRVETVDCEDSLFETRKQKIFVEDIMPPEFSSFPDDKQVDFMHSYGTQDLGFPTVYDSCGHGPSSLQYSDKVVNSDFGQRRIERTWTAQDSCGNKKSRVQNILIKNSQESPNEYDYRNFNVYSDQIKTIHNSEIEGRIYSKMEISLENSTIGEDIEFVGMSALSDQFKTQCFGKKPKYILMSESEIKMRNTSVNGPLISYTSSKPIEFKMSPAELSIYLNRSLTELNNGPKQFICTEQAVDHNRAYPIKNFLNSSCQVSDFKQQHVNAIDPAKLKFLNADTQEQLLSLRLRGNELVYNVFYLNNLKVLSRLDELNIRIPRNSFAIINIDLENDGLQPLSFRSFLSIANIEKPENVLFNFVNKKATRIEFKASGEETVKIYGTILAPHSEVLFGENVIHYGQLISKSTELNNYKQVCNQFELFKYF